MAKRRSKVTDAPVLKHWEQVDQNLKKIANLNLELDKTKSELNRKIFALKEKAKNSSENIYEEKVKLEKDVEDFAMFHQDDFNKTRTKELNFAMVGFRKSRALKTLPKWTWKKVLAKLIEMKRKKFIKIKESVNKLAIREAGLSDEEMAVFGCQIQVDDEFWYEIKEEAIQSMPEMELATGTDG